MTAQKRTIEVEATVSEALPRGKFQFKVELKNGHKAIVYLAGKMNKDVRINGVRVSVGDTVTVELSPYDLNSGRIIGKKQDARK